MREGEPLGLEEAQAEAFELKKKIETGEANSYEDAFQKLNLEQMAAGDQLNETDLGTPSEDLTPEESELLQRMESETGHHKSITTFDLKRDGEVDFLYKDVDLNEQLLDKIVQELGLSGEWKQRLLSESTESLQQARDDANFEYITFKDYYNHPALIPACFKGFENCTTQKEFLQAILGELEFIKSFLEKLAAVIRIIDCVLGLKTNEEAKQNQELTDSKISFDDLVSRYAKYFGKDGRVSEPAPAVQLMVESKSYNDDYNRWWSMLRESNPGYLARTFSGERVVDLGCGNKALAMAECVMESGAREYIGVDKYNQAEDVNDYGKETNQACIAVMDDLLNFLRSEPDNSALIMANGLDEFVFDLGNRRTVEYIKKVAVEIARVAGKHNIVGIESFPIFRELKKLGFTVGRLGYPNEDTSIETYYKLRPPKSELVHDLFGSVQMSTNESPNISAKSE